MIAIINYIVISSSESIIDIAKDFIALMVIADFDNIFGSLGTNGYKIFGKLSGGEAKAIRII